MKEGESGQSPYQRHFELLLEISEVLAPDAKVLRGEVDKRHMESSGRGRDFIVDHTRIGVPGEYPSFVTFATWGEPWQDMFGQLSLNLLREGDNVPISILDGVYRGSLDLAVPIGFVEITFLGGDKPGIDRLVLTNSSGNKETVLLSDGLEVDGPSGERRNKDLLKELLLRHLNGALDLVKEMS